MAKRFLKKENALSYSYKHILPVAQATLHKRVICSAGNLVKGDNQPFTFFVPAANGKAADSQIATPKSANLRPLTLMRMFVAKNSIAGCADCYIKTCESAAIAIIFTRVFRY